MGYKYTLIVSELYGTRNFVIVKTDVDFKRYIKTFREFILELENFKSGGKNEKYLGDFEEEYITENIRHRYNLNGNGDLYVINFETINQCLWFALQEAEKEFKELRNMTHSDEMKHLVYLRHNETKFNEIVKKYFEII